MQTHIAIALNSVWLSAVTVAAESKGVTVPMYIKLLIRRAHPELPDLRRGPVPGIKKETVRLSLTSEENLLRVVDEAISTGLKCELLSAGAFGTKSYGGGSTTLRLSPEQIGAIKALAPFPAAKLRSTAEMISRHETLASYLAWVKSLATKPAPA